jgi:hypothetical protein
MYGGYKMTSEQRVKVVTNYYKASTALMEIGTIDNLPTELLRLTIQASVATSKIVDFINNSIQNKT